MLIKLKMTVQFLLFVSSYFFSSIAFSQNIQVVTENLPPYSFIEEGEVVGASTEVVHALFNELNLHADIVMYPWERAYQMALHQKNTLIYSLVRYEERESLFQWVGIIAPMKACLFSLKSNQNIKINEITDIKKYSIIALRHGGLADSLMKRGLTDKSKLRQTISMEDNFSMLLAGRVDLLASPELSLYDLVKNRGYKPSSLIQKLHCTEISNLYLAFSLNTPEELVKKFRQALAVLKEKGAYQEILNKYLY